MQRYNGQLINQFSSIINGNAAAGALVTVKLKSTGATVTLYAEDDLGGATLANPLTADAKGYYGFYAPDGVYTLDVSISGTPQLEIQLNDVAALQAQFNDALANAGYVPVGTFAAGCTVSQSNGVVSDGSSFWRWDGALPKTVTAGSAPTPTGVGNWVLVSDGGLRGDLASPSSTVSIAGVTAKNIARRYTESVNVADYGAVGDGVTDDTAAIQAAINANLGRQINFNQGSFLITSTLQINTTGLGNTSAPKLQGSGMYDTILINKTGSSTIFIQSGTADEFAYNLEISDLSLSGDAVSSNTIGLRIEGCRFVTVSNVRISGMKSHGIYGLSVSGDFTDNSSMQFNHVQIEDCGGYGVYASSGTPGIQYQWNMSECRIGFNTLGGLLFESITNLNLSGVGVYYNGGFGLRITKPAGGIASKIIFLDQCEFDTNQGTQIDLLNVECVKIKQPYLIANTGLPTSFVDGINVNPSVTSCVIESAYPRFASALTGLTVMRFQAGCTDIVVRDTVYNGFSVLNGNMYVLGEPSVVIDDRSNRNRTTTGTYTAQVKDSTLAKVSPTSIVANYSISGRVVTVGFRNLNNIDTSVFAGGDLIGVSLPVACSIGATSSFVGECVITTDSASANAPMPFVSNGGGLCLFVRSGTGSLLVASDLTSGVSDIQEFTLTYIID